MAKVEAPGAFKGEFFSGFNDFKKLKGMVWKKILVSKFNFTIKR